MFWFYKKRKQNAKKRKIRKFKKKYYKVFQDTSTWNYYWISVPNKITRLIFKK